MAQAKKGAKGTITGLRTGGLTKTAPLATKTAPVVRPTVSPVAKSQVQTPRVTVGTTAINKGNVKGAGVAGVTGLNANRQNYRGVNTRPFYTASPAVVIGGFNLGFPLYNGFNPYVLQGSSGLYPDASAGYPVQAYQAPIGQAQANFAPAFSGSLFAEPTQSTQSPSFSAQPISPPTTLNPFRAGTLEFAPEPRLTAAMVEIIVPTDSAEVWFNGAKTQTTGQKRQFVTPELSPGQDYTYQVRVRWSFNGKDYEETRQVTVQAGNQSMVNFMILQKDKLPLPPGIKI
jgi:uncharacterized protein (TIGR03000 family)